MQVLEILEIAAVLAAGLFTGAAAYINVVEHPVWVRALGTDVAVAAFRGMYARAAPVQASLAILGALAGVGAWWSGAGVGWLVGALALGGVVPWTFAAMMAINNRLQDASLEASSQEARALLVRWGRRHALRSGLGLVAFGLFTILAIRG